MRAGVIVVHYRGIGETARAVASFRRELAAAGLVGEVVVVDNGADPAERSELAALPARLLEPGANLGYAGGLALGSRDLDADLLLLANPDLELGPGCVAALAQAVAAGAAAAGPRFFWDRRRTLVLPPTERRDRWSALLAAASPAGGVVTRHARRRWRRHARRHWQATSPVPSYQLSGALLAVSRAAWDRVGPFDASFRLFFEEDDWLHRLARSGLPAVYVPAAEVIHAHGTSAPADPVRTWFAESQRRFERRYYGRGFRTVQRAVAQCSRRRGAELREAQPAGPVEARRPRLDLAAIAARAERRLWVEISPQATGFPAAARHLPAGTGSWELPAEVWDVMSPGRWRLAVTDDRGRELHAASFVR